jgi:hypothetical protein
MRESQIFKDALGRVTALVDKSKSDRLLDEECGVTIADLALLLGDVRSSRAPVGVLTLGLESGQRQSALLSMLPVGRRS